MGNTDLVVVDLVVILMQMHFDNYVNKYKLNILVIIFLESYLSKHSIKSFNLIAYTVQGVPKCWAHFVFVIFLGSGACTEELLTFIQQPWKFAP